MDKAYSTSLVTVTDNFAGITILEFEIVIRARHTSRSDCIFSSAKSAELNVCACPVKFRFADLLWRI